MLATIKKLLRPVKRVTVHAIYGEPISRKTLARQFLSGHGIEIGALHLPLAVPSKAKVRYVDRMSVVDLRRHYPELAALPLVPIDVVDDGETLQSLQDASEDFVIANHFLEHCQDPIRTIGNVMRVLKPGGVFFLAVPDKRATFDVDRPVTTLDHAINDFENGPAGSRAAHFAESVELTNGLRGAEADAEVKRLMDINYSIHFHIWDMNAFLLLLIEAQRHYGFDIDFAMSHTHEIITVLRKAGGSVQENRGKMARSMLASVCLVGHRSLSDASPQSHP